MQQHRQEMQARCKADPTKCDEMKQQARERWKAHHGAGSPPAGGGAGRRPPQATPGRAAPQ